MNLASIFESAKSRVGSIFPFASRVIDQNDPSSFGRFMSMVLFALVIVMNVVYVVVGIVAFFQHRIDLRDILPSASAFFSESSFALSPYLASKGMDVAKSYKSQDADKQ